MSTTTRSKSDLQRAAQSAVPAAERILFTHHHNDTTCVLQTGDLACTWELAGTPFETAEPEAIAAVKGSLINFYHAVRASDQAEPTALWVHRVRDKARNFELQAEFPSEFARRVNAEYWRGLQDRNLKDTSLYFTLILRPTATATGFARRLTARSLAGAMRVREEAAQRFETLQSQVDASLAKFGGRRLSRFSRETAAGRQECSEPASFYRFLLTGRWETVVLQPSPMKNYLCNARIVAGDTNGIVLSRSASGQRFFGFLDICDYPEFSEPGMNNVLATSNFSFVETQSFAFKGRREGVASLKLQKGRLISSGEASEEQILAMDDAIEDVRCGRIFMGEYHYSLAVLGDSIPEVQSHLSTAKTLMTEEIGYSVAVVDLIPEDAHFAQLPGHFKARPRTADLTSRNFSALAPMHNFAQGKREGNPWGQAVTIFETPSSTPYAFNFQATPLGRDSRGERVAGNTFITGATGAGKSVVLGHLITQLTKYDNLAVCFFDKDQGAEGLIRALGGNYRRLRVGENTGLNPFQWTKTARTVEFTQRLVLDLALQADEVALSIGMENQLKEKVGQVFDLPRPLRRISALMQMVGESSELGQRLRKWCDTESHRGEHHWVLDNPEDTLNISANSIQGFDYTDFIDNPDVSGPIVSIILEAMDSMIDGRPFVYVMEEFAKVLASRAQALVEFARDKQTTIRKLNGMGIFVTQSPSQLKDYPIADTLREQCPVKIYLPNPSADRHLYCDGWGLTETEFETLKNWDTDSRLMLIKQGATNPLGSNSAIVRLDLGHMLPLVDVMSGNPDRAQLLSEIRTQTGDHPDQWLDHFIAAIQTDKRKLLSK